MFDNSKTLLAPILDKIKCSRDLTTCFLLTHVPDPKINKRIRVFKEYGATSVVCTRRKSQDVWEPAFRDVEHFIFDIDLPTSKHMFKRAFVSREYQKKAYDQLKKIRPTIIYADGLDSIIIAIRYSKKYGNTVIFYDVADLREVYIEKPQNSLKYLITQAIKMEEKRCFRSIDWLVVTSPKFYDEYYNRLINPERVLFIPNAPDKNIFEGYKRKQTGDFTIGFIGGIRYLTQMKMLVDVAGECGVKVLFSGAGGTTTDYEEITRYCKDKEYVSFTGKYKYESDIAKLYGMVDCVFAVYDADNPNVRIALPNKLYESITCGLPIIVAKGTYLSELVENWGVGFSVHHKDKSDLVNVINSLKMNDKAIKTIEDNCKRINDETAKEAFNTKFHRMME